MLMIYCLYNVFYSPAGLYSAGIFADIPGRKTIATRPACGTHALFHSPHLLRGPARSQGRTWTGTVGFQKWMVCYPRKSSNMDEVHTRFLQMKINHPNLDDSVSHPEVNVL